MPTAARSPRAPASSRDTGGREPRNRCQRDGRTVARVRTATGPPGRRGLGAAARFPGSRGSRGRRRSASTSRPPHRPWPDSSARLTPYTSPPPARTRAVRAANQPSSKAASAAASSQTAKIAVRARSAPIAVAPRPVPSSRAKRRPGVPRSRSRSVPRRASATGARHSGSRSRWNDATPGRRARRRRRTARPHPRRRAAPRHRPGAAAPGPRRHRVERADAAVGPGRDVHAAGRPRVRDRRERVAGRRPTRPAARSPAPTAPRPA